MSDTKNPIQSQTNLKFDATATDSGDGMVQLTGGAGELIVYLTIDEARKLAEKLEQAANKAEDFLLFK